MKQEGPDAQGAPIREPGMLFSAPDIRAEARADGSIVLRSARPAPAYPRSVSQWLVKWAAQAPDRDFLCERESNDPGARWRRKSYGQALRDVEAIATWLLRNGLNQNRPLAILSDNSIDHAMLVLACSHAGVPVSSISVAYSLVSTDHGKLKTIVEILDPGAIFVADGQTFGKALAAIEKLHNAKIIAGANAEGGMVPLSEVRAHTDRALVETAYAATGPDTVAKILFTSGSTGTPKGVINTQRMLTFSQELKAQCWTFLDTTPVRTLDWLPWSHTFGANHNFNMVLRGGGTMYIDNGRPAPGVFQRTLDNIRDAPGNVMFNVPRGYDLLAAALRADEELRRAFFANLQIVFYAGAALPQSLWAELTDMAIATIGEPVVMTTAWGSTETSPLAADCHFQAPRSGNIGVPPPGVELKLTPNAGKQEIRVRGPVVTPAYWKRPDLTKDAFDEEGFYKIGDAVRLADPDNPSLGLYFDGRVSEDFKLTTGTWVNTGALRLKAIDALAPLAQDVVVAGHDRSEIGLLVFANAQACRAMAGLSADAGIEEAISHPAVVEQVRKGLAALKAEGGGSSSFAPRALLMGEPPSVDGGEITDKGYINQRAVLSRRAELAEALYNDATPGLIRI